MNIAVKSIQVNRVFLFILLTLLSFSKPILGQNQSSTQTSIEKKNDDYLSQIRTHVFQNKLDSARILLSNIDTTIYPETRRLDYIRALYKIINSNSFDYKAQYTFVNFAGNEIGTNFSDWSNYIDEHIVEPSDKKGINPDYVKILWEQIGINRNYLSIEKASERNIELKKYIDQFDPNEKEVIRAIGAVKTHEVVLALIGKDLELGLQLCHELDSMGKQINDTLLLLSSSYHLSDFLIAQGKLDDYIANCEKCFSLENGNRNSQYFIPNITNLLNAYIHKGGNEERIQELFDILNYYKNTEQTTYYLYAQYVKSLPKDSPTRQKIFEKFGATNILEFGAKLSAKAEEHLMTKSLVDFYNQLSIAMLNSGYPEEAFKYKSRSADVVQEIYSEKLSNTLAEFKTEQAVKEKEAQIKSEREKKQLHIVISVLSVFLLIVFIFVAVRVKKQNTQLAQKNSEIEQQRDDIAKREDEKAMLLKEIHHRVKNNFQIISSLLELQSKDIKDAKALELAKEGKNRVQSMALIHQRLYQNDDLKIYFDDFIERLVTELSRIYGVEKDKTILNVEKFSFDIDTAIPLGLIINELVTNAMKYGLNDQENKLTVGIKSEGDNIYKLIVSDNGVGLPEGFDIQKTKSLGLKLVRRLTKQLKGQFSYVSSEGATFEVIFKNSIARGEID